MNEKSSKNSHVLRNVLIAVSLLAMVGPFLSPESSVRCAASWQFLTLKAFTSPMEKDPPRLSHRYSTNEKQTSYRFLEPPLGGIDGKAEYWIVTRYWIFYVSEYHNGG